MREYPELKKALQEKLLKGEVTPVQSKDRDTLLLFKLDSGLYFTLNGREMNLLKGDYIVLNKDDSLGCIFEENMMKEHYKNLLENTNYIDTYIIAAKKLFPEEYSDKREAFIKDLIFANKAFENRDVKERFNEEERDNLNDALFTAIKEKLKQEEKEKEERDLIEKKVEKRDTEIKKQATQKQKEIDYYLNMMTDILNSADYSEREKIDDAGDRIEDASSNPNKSHEVTKEAAITREYDKVEESEDIKEEEEIKEEEMKVEEPKNGTRTILDDILEIDDDDDDRYERYTERTLF